VSTESTESTKVRAKRALSEEELPKLRLRRYRVVDYEEAALALENDLLYFVEGIKRQTAHKAARALSRRLGEKVTAEPVEYDGMRGYVFIRGDLESWISRAAERARRGPSPSGRS